MIDAHAVMGHPAVLSVGWALVHALWVGMLLACGLWLALRVMPDRPGTRYRVSAATLLAIPLITGLVLVVHQPWLGVTESLAAGVDSAQADIPASAGGDAGLVFPVAPDGLEPGPGVWAQPTASADGASETLVIQDASASGGQAGVLSALLPYAAVLYAVGLCVMVLRLLGGWWLTLWLRTRGLSPLPAGLAGVAERALRRSGVGRSVRFAVSTRAAVPCVVGVLRPVVLLPTAAVTGLTPTQLSSILAHELAHVRRHDVLINLVQVLIETLLFFHPAVWWVGRQLRAERERCCDDDAVLSVGSPLAYVDALAAVAGLDAGRPGLSLAATDGGLSGRVKRLLSPRDAGQGRSSVWGAGLLAVLIVGLVLTVVACGDSGAADEDEGDTEQVDDDGSAGDEGASPEQGELPDVKPPRILAIDFQKLKDGDMRYNVVIRPGDIISVPDPNAGFVYIMGNINRPGAYTIPGEQELTLYRLFASAGGLSGQEDGAELGEGEVLIADVIRQISDTDQDIYRVSLQGIADGTEADIYLRQNDLINFRVGTMQEVLDFEQPEWVQAQLKAEYPEGVRPIITHDLPRPEMPGLSPITEADLTPTAGPYVIRSGDTINVTIFELRIPGRDDIQEVRVDEGGNIRLAVVGTVQAAGLTEKQLEVEIARALVETTAMRSATVGVQVIHSNHNTYTVFAQSTRGGTRSGSYVIPKPNFRLIEAITIAGNVPGRTRYLYVIRSGEGTADPKGVPSAILPAGGIKPGAAPPPLPGGASRVDPGQVPSGSTFPDPTKARAVEPAPDGEKQMEQLIAKFGELGRLLEDGRNAEDIGPVVSELLKGAEPIVRSLRPGSTRATVEGLFEQLEAMKRALDAGDVEKAKTIFQTLVAVGESIPDLVEEELADQSEAERKALGLTAGEHLEKLAETYGLKAGEDLRVIYPPFSEQRSFFADAEYPYAKGADNIKSLGFWWDGKTLDGSYMSYAPKTSEDVLTGSSLRLPWYQLEHLDRLDWDPGVSDWVARKGMPIEQALKAFARVYTEQTGKMLRFEKRVVTRPCVLQDSMKGEKVIFPPVKDREFRKVMLTIDPLSDEELAAWKKDRPEGATHRFQAKYAGQAIDTPILSSVHLWKDERTMTMPGVFYIGAKAQQLSHTDEGYRENLQKIVDNLRAQVGGEWRIEDQTFDVWRPVVDERDE